MQSGPAQLLRHRALMNPAVPWAAGGNAGPMDSLRLAYELHEVCSANRLQSATVMSCFDAVSVKPCL